MNTHTNKTQEKQNNSTTSTSSQKRNRSGPTFQFVDNRPEAIAQRKLQEMANNSPTVTQLTDFQNLANSNQTLSLVTQLQSITSDKPIQMYPGEDLVRRLKAKFKKKKQDATDLAEGAYHGRGIHSRYEKLDAPSEQDHYDDMLDEEAEGRERLENHPIAERARKYGMKPLAYVAKKGGEALGNLAAGPVGGKVAEKAVGMGMDKLDEIAKNKLNEDGNAYKVLRERDEDEDD